MPVKPPAKHSVAQPSNSQRNRLSWRERLGYGTGDVGYNFLFDMGQLYLLKFMTDGLGLNPAVGGTVFLVAKIWDGFADMAVGTWIDNKRKPGRFGRYKSFILYSVIPLALLLIANFTVPEMSLSGKTIWAYAAYIIFGTVYSIGNVSYGSMIPTMTRDPQERAVLSSIRQGGSNLGLLIATVAFMPIVHLFTNQRHGYTVAVTCFAIAGIALICFMCSSVKERFTHEATNAAAPSESKVPLRTQFKLLLHNRPLIGIAFANLFSFSAFNVKLAVQVYFTQYILHDDWALSYLGLFSIGCVFPAVAIAPWLSKKIGKRNTYILGCAIWFVADTIAFFAVHSTLSLVIFSCFAYFGSGLPTSLNWGMVSDCVEYGEYKSEVRNEALTYSSFTWFRKISQAAAGFIPGAVLATVGYVANAENQSSGTIFGIRALMFVYPLVMCVLTIIMMKFVYNLSDDKVRHLIDELDARQVSKLASSGPTTPTASPSDNEFPSSGASND
ncbi:MFS transporter [Acidipropionibacterium virtanenii]|uniref:2,3-dihydroxypropane-1-sulfonate exporter n=1 Tax=Acidipropionibacterium virtanenii TaxID=2057246 RepID=A0A344UQZ1_9ACTN|nr:MFS transporter [Acidipropionibacterium virtanenii]AXE37689.1 Putative 2,3-dihydroxypropane-1-sulfonate exporter [Acidipropionibacterium virtanenii]